MYKLVVNIITFFWVCGVFFTMLSVPAILFAWLINGDFFEATKGADYFSLVCIYVFFLLSTVFICIETSESKLKNVQTHQR